MADEAVDLLHGTLEMLALKALAAEPLHGFGVARWIESVTDERLSVEEGALYPALHRMEKRGWLESEWRMTENSRRARFYRLTDEGREELKTRIREWKGASWAVERVLGAEPAG